MMRDFQGGFMEKKNNRSSFKWKNFNLLDAIIIIVSLIVFTFFLYFWNPYEWFADTNITQNDFQASYLRYDIECIGLPADDLSKLKVGSEIFGENGEVIGLIEEVISFGYNDLAQSETNLNNKKVYIKIKTECFEKEVGYIVNGMVIDQGINVTIGLESSDVNDSDDEIFEINGKCISAFLISKENYYGKQ